MKKINWLLPLIFILVGGMFTACRNPEPTPTVVPTSTVTSTATTTATFTATATMTVTPTPTLTATSTATVTVTPVPESASLPRPTLHPEIQPYFDLFTNDDALASLYPDSVEIVRSPEEMVLAVNLTMGFALGLPTDMIMLKEVDTENMLASYQGYSFSEPRLRLFSVQIILMDRGKEPPLQGIVDFAKDQAENNLIGSRDVIESGQETVTINGVDGKFLYYLTTDGEKAGYYNFLIMIEKYSTNQTLLAYYSLIEGELSEYDARQDMVIAKEIMITSYQQLVKENVATDLLNQHAYDIITGLCPTDTDETFGYTKENPIKVAAFPIQDHMAKVFAGPLAEKQYLESLLFDGQQIKFVRRGSVDGEDGILDIYEVTGPGIEGSISLYLDMYNTAPYRVPVGFGCTGLQHTDQVLDFYQSGN